MNEELLKELKEINKKLDLLGITKRWQKIPEAAETLGIPRYRLKILCDKGIIPATLLNLTSKNKNYRVDIPGAMKVIEEGGVINKELKRK